MQDIHIRKVEAGDMDRGFLESLDALRPASGLGPVRAGRILSEILANPHHRIFVAVLGGRVVGSITIIIEQKFIHSGGRAGHIEDVVVSAGMQGRHVGARLVEFALDYARDAGCYKTVLDCSDDVRRFYEKLGFSGAGNCMRFDYPV